MRGPWNEGGDWEFVQSPAFMELRDSKTGERETDSDGSAAQEPPIAGASSSNKTKAARSKKKQ